MKQARVLLASWLGGQRLPKHLLRPPPSERRHAVARSPATPSGRTCDERVFAESCTAGRRLVRALHYWPRAAVRTSACSVGGARIESAGEAVGRATHGARARFGPLQDSAARHCPLRCDCQASRSRKLVGGCAWSMGGRVAVGQRAQL